MDKICKTSKLIGLVLFVLFLAACGQAQEQVEPVVSPEEKQTEGTIAANIVGVDIENNNTAQEDDTREGNMEENDTQENSSKDVDDSGPISEESDNPYRNRGETLSGAWMEALYETHKGVSQIEAGEIIYTFDLHPDKDSIYRQSYTYQITLPYFLRIQDDEILQKIQQRYLEQDWMLTKEEKEEYVALAADYNFHIADRYNFWRAYRQHQFITVIFEHVTGGDRWFSCPYADVFWADTGEPVTLEDLFGGKEEDLEKLLAESGRKIPDGCVLEEWENWELDWELLFEKRPREVPLPKEADRSFFPTPYGIVFSYPAGEIGTMAAGAILVFVDWESLKGIYEL